MIDSEGRVEGGRRSAQERLGYVMAGTEAVGVTSLQVERGDMVVSVGDGVAMEVRQEDL